MILHYIFFLTSFMIQGWHNDDYLIVFDNEAEAFDMANRYAIGTSLPGYELVGLKGWDDFILRDSAGALFTVPTLPIRREHVQPLDVRIDSAKVDPDSRFTDRIKWNVQPLVFGGDTNAEQNISWVTFDQHAELVKWWNNKYRELNPS